MKKYLEKFGVIRLLKFEVPMKNQKVVSKFEELVQEGSPTNLFSFLDSFTATNQRYKGRVTHRGFKIRRTAEFDRKGIQIPLLEGEFIRSSKGTDLNVKISGLSPIMIYLLFSPLIAIVMFTVFWLVNFFPTDLYQTMLLGLSVMLVVNTVIQTISLSKIVRKVSLDFKQEMLIIDSELDYEI